jgi:hypothetical protein
VLGEPLTIIRHLNATKIRASWLHKFAGERNTGERNCCLVFGERGKLIQCLNERGANQGQIAEVFKILADIVKEWPGSLLRLADTSYCTPSQKTNATAHLIAPITNVTSLTSYISNDAIAGKIFKTVTVRLSG